MAQIGNDIDGEAAGDLSGFSVCLSSDGSLLAIGAVYNDGAGYKSGHVRIYKNDSGVWTQVGCDIDGEAADDLSGCSVSLSADGIIVAMGASTNDGTGISAGHVRVYSFTSGIEENLNNLKIFPNPVSESLSVDLQPIGEAFYAIIDTQGSEIQKGSYSGDQIDVSSLTPGTYFLQIENDGKLFSGEFVKE